MKVSEIRDMTTSALEGRLDDTREELFKLRFQFRSGQLTDYTRLRATRRTIAQIATVLRERELAAELAAKGEPS
jgi:large subunit ribosomal protein L29